MLFSIKNDGTVAKFTKKVTTTLKLPHECYPENEFDRVEYAVDEADINFIKSFFPENMVIKTVIDDVVIPKELKWLDGYKLKNIGDLGLAIELGKEEYEKQSSITIIPLEERIDILENAFAEFVEEVSSNG